jgi:GNAT superfamily N-acetyltransferase
MSSELVVRQAREEDAGAILVLWQEMMAFHAAREPFFTISAEGPGNFLKWVRARIGKNGTRVVVAEAGGGLAGYCLAVLSCYPPVFLKDDYCEIYDLAVTDRYRRSGVGRALFLDVKAWSAAKGITRIEARVALANELSTKFWRALGLRPYMESLYLDL